MVELDESLTWVWETFWLLNTTRSIGMAAGPIPLSAVLQYADWRGVSKDVADELVHYVAAMDAVYLRLAIPRKDKRNGHSLAPSAA